MAEQILILSKEKIVWNEAKENHRTFKGNITAVEIINDGNDLQITFSGEDEEKKKEEGK